MAGSLVIVLHFQLLHDVPCTPDQQDAGQGTCRHSQAVGDRVDILLVAGREPDHQVG